MRHYVKILVDFCQIIFFNFLMVSVFKAKSSRINSFFYWTLWSCFLWINSTFLRANITVMAYSLENSQISIFLDLWSFHSIFSQPSKIISQTQPIRNATKKQYTQLCWINAENAKYYIWQRKNYQMADTKMFHYFSFSGLSTPNALQKVKVSVKTITHKKVKNVCSSKKIVSAL